MNKPWHRIRATGLVALVLLAPVAQGCTDLDESPVSSITPENFYRNETEVLGGLASVYAELRGTLWGYYNMSQVSSDEMIVPTRGQDWYDNGRWLEIHKQAWTPNSPAGLEDIGGVWNNLWSGVARANVLLGALENVTVANQAAVEAEVRALRAFYYYMLMDMFGGVPIVEDTDIKPRERDSRSEVFAFLEKELNEARAALPAAWPAGQHGRMTKGAADAILANMYLNAGVFNKNDGVSATAYNSCGDKCQAAVDAADRVLNSGVYRLNDNWRQNFTPDNHTSPENILVVKHLNTPDMGMNFVYRSNHYNQNPSGWNGFSSLAETYFAFDQADERIKIFQVGLQRDANGNPLQTRDGKPLSYSPEIKDATQASETEGARIVKFPADPAGVVNGHSNDFPYFRLGEMYLVKAEALNELGRTAEAVQLVNRLRERVFNPDKPLTGSFTKESFRAQVLKERLFELTAEAKRRQDLIRHGQYTKAWAFKDAGAPRLILMPIPQNQLDTNPLLTQNPGY